MNEPLKNKTIKIASWTKDIQRSKNNLGYHTKDIESAVEWLKENIESGEAFGQYLWTQYQTENEVFNNILADLIRDVSSQIDRHKELIDEAFEDCVKH